jgi:hypothetical protein
VVFSPDGCGLCFAQLDESSRPKLHDHPGPSGAPRPGRSAHSGTAGQAPRSLPKSVHTVSVIICVGDGGSLPIASASHTVERAGDTHDGCHDLSQIASQRGAYRDMRADSTSVRSIGHRDDTSADASSTSRAAPSAGTSAGAAQARWSAEGPKIVGLRSGTVLDPELVAKLRAVAARTDIAHRVLTILEPGQGPKSRVAAGRHGR